MTIDYARKRVQSLVLIAFGFLMKIVSAHLYLELPSIDVPQLGTHTVDDALMLLGVGWLIVGGGYKLIKDYKNGKAVNHPTDVSEK